MMSDKKLEVGDYAFIYFQGFPIQGIILDRKYTKYGKKSKDPNEYDYWNYWYKMKIDDKDILNYELEFTSVLSSFGFSKDEDGYYYKGVGNDFNLDIERIREERLKKLLD